MRKNRILGAAIAAALSMQMGIAYAGGSFLNETASGGTSPTDYIAVPEDGIRYASELFGSSVGVPALPSTTGTPATPRAKVTYTVGTAEIKGADSSDKLVVKFEFPGGEKFAEHPTLNFVNVGGTCTGPISTPNSTPTEGGTNNSYVIFKVDTSTTTLCVEAGDELELLYRVAGVTADATVTMQASLQADSPLVNKDVTRTATVILPSAPAIEIDLKPQLSGWVKIDVNNDEKKFVGDSTTLGAYQDEFKAEIGTILVKNLSVTAAATTAAQDDYKVMESTGAAEFKFTGATTGDTVVSTSLNKLEITGGQFNASTASGMVYIDIDNDNLYDSTTDPVAVVDAATNTATFKLSDAHMNTLATANDFRAIRMQVNGTTPINIVEVPPHGTFTVDFKQGENVGDTYGVEGHVKEADLLQIKRNGTVCWILNVHKGESTMPADYPGPNAPDKPYKNPFGSSIRISNTTGVDGKLTALMYDKDGTQLAGGLLLDPIKPGITEVFDAWRLRDIYGIGAWSGRAALVISSTLSKMEVMSLLRHEPGGPLTNVSIGAGGASCTN